jgi:hypothetical protein
MSVHCLHCSYEILPNGEHMPPWCPRCGADLKPGQSVKEPQLAQALPAESSGIVATTQIADETPTYPAEPAEPEQDFTSVPAGEGDCCPSCRTGIDFPDYPDERQVVCCPECGQCLQAPAPWSPSGAARVRLSGFPNPEPKFSGWVGISIGSLLGLGACIIPEMEIFLRLAGLFFGATLFVEGSGRICDKMERRLPRRKPHLLDMPQELPQEVNDLGSLKAVFCTDDRLVPAAAVLCIALAFACLEVYLIVWLRNGAVHPKLLIAALVCPVLVLYTLYRAGRMLIERRQIMVFSRGLVSIQGRKMDVYPWDKIAGFSQAATGDAIDERAINIQPKFGQAPLRFTCAHFPNLDKLWDRLQHEFPARQNT